MERFPLNSRAFPIRRDETLEKSHGRIEKRTIEVASVFPGYPAWPGARQIFRIHRIVDGAQQREDHRCGITSLSSHEAGSARLLSLVREDWGIENGVHYIRDTVFKEDACRVRHRGKAQNLAALRNTAIALLRGQGVENITEAVEVYAENRERALLLVAVPRTE